jgi:hypothetical protein
VVSMGYGTVEGGGGGKITLAPTGLIFSTAPINDGLLLLNPLC